MARVRHSDISAFSRGLETLYNEADIASLAGRVTKCLRDLFDCELVTFDLIDLSAARWNTLVVSPMLPDWDAVMTALQQHASEHPIVSHAACHRYPHAIRTSDLLSLRQYHQTGIYHDLFVPYVSRLDRQLGFVAQPSSTLAFGASVNRKGRDFSVEQRALLELLRPHLLQAHLLAQAHQEMQEREQAARETAAAAVGGGLCQIGPDGKLEWMTAAVDPLLASYFASSRSGSNYLPAELLTAMRLIWVKPRKGLEGPPAPGQTWYFRRAFGTLKVHLAAHDASGQTQLLLVEEPGDPSTETLAARHGLSRREAETLYWIGQGKTNEEIGIILSISTRTAQKHTERLFEKLDVSNRTAAARVAMGKD